MTHGTCCHIAVTVGIRSEKHIHKLLHLQAEIYSLYTKKVFLTLRITIPWKTLLRMTTDPESPWISQIGYTNIYEQ